MIKTCADRFSVITSNKKFSLCITVIKRAFLLKVVITIIFILVNVWYGGSVLRIWKKLQQHGSAYPLSITNATTNTTLAPPICTKFPPDITLFNTKKNDTSFCCQSCALVSSSGIMTGSKAGTEIDQNECIIRMNNAPTSGYEVDVGSRTTFRIFSHTSVMDVKNLMRSYRPEMNSTIPVLIAWGPKRNMKPGAITYIHLRDISRLFPEARLYTFSNARMQKADDIFQIETGKNRLLSGAYLSTGWFSILFAKDVCEEIHIYGMVEDHYCDKVFNRILRDSPYHYYSKDHTQCSTYLHHENVPQGGHRFITEKRIFKKWAKEWKNMKFHYPEWS